MSTFTTPLTVQAAHDLPARPRRGRPPIHNEASVRAVLAGYVERLGRLPSHGELERGGHAGEATWLARNVGRQADIARWMGVGYDDRRVYDSLEAICRYVAPMAATLGRMPTENELQAAGFAGAVRATQRHGGLTAVAARLGYAANRPGDPRRAASQVCLCGTTHRTLVSESCPIVRCGRIDIEALRGILERRQAGLIDDSAFAALSARYRARRR